MPWINVNVDIELDEIYDQLTTIEKKMLVEWLDADNLISRETEYSGITNSDFNETCDKLAQSYYRMTKDDEETIIRIMKKYNVC